MSTESMPNAAHRADQRMSPALVATLQSTLLLFLLLFPVTFMWLFFHEAGHALHHLVHGARITFFYIHPFPFVGYVRPIINYYDVWMHASGWIVGDLVPLVIFLLLWKRRSFYTLPFLLVFPLSAIFTGVSVSEINTTGDIYNILQITGWQIPSTVIFIYYLINFVAGIFFFISLLPLMGLSPQDKKSLFVLPAAMLLYCVPGLIIAHTVVPGSPIDVQYHQAREIITSANYRPLLMGLLGALLAVIYITLYRRVHERLPAGLRTERISLSWRDLWYPAVLCAISVILGLIALT